ncbi:fimbrial protein [Providencia manganoxydans]|uniref:Fimbrial-type adhesion domain-containing protein n=1 Tax=Providencia stuartii TaxID=588 RepID=A0A1S1HV24_PROST|nr:fimbrial protein [Providencia stuartii]OHT25732.1 hypothetical protein A3Q29_12060 [Providencia stuartii]
MKYRVSRLFLFLLLALSQKAVSETTALSYEGTLISLACMVDDSSPVAVNLGLIEDKRLYLHQDSEPTLFSLTLKDCDPSLANGVNVTLEALPGGETEDGYLLLDSGSVASGAVIGIKDSRTGGTRIPLGSTLPKQPIATGTMTIPLFAYLHITPEALQERAVVPGAFTATLYYKINFE